MRVFNPNVYPANVKVSVKNSDPDPGCNNFNGYGSAVLRNRPDPNFSIPGKKSYQNSDPNKEFKYF